MQSTDNLTEVLLIATQLLGEDGWGYQQPHQDAGTTLVVCAGKKTLVT